MIQLIEIDPDKEYEPNLSSAPEFENLMAIYRDYYPLIGYQIPWVGYFILMDGQLVGSCGFAGAPQSGSVEIAYWTITAYKGRGIATSACANLITIAWEAQPQLVIRAKTAPEKNASTRILEKRGFRFTGVVQDHEIGDAWEWQLLPK